MKQTQIQLPEIKIIGIKTITNNKDEMDPLKAKIHPILKKYFGESLFKKIPNRKNNSDKPYKRTNGTTYPEITYCVYSAIDVYSPGFESDYAYFVGEQVTSFDNVPDGFEALVIPPQNYVKFTTDSGPLPDICIKSWQEIWKMTPKQLGGKNAGIAAFETYDERAYDHQNAVFDIYVGITK